jgi:hypothetical protein
MNNVRKTLTTGIVLAAICSLSAWAHDSNSASSPDDNNSTAKTAKPPFTISKETTYFTEPLDHDGYVDYLAALNNLCSEGVTPENNAAVPLWEAIGPNAIDADYREQFFKMLGINPLPGKGDYLISFNAYLERIGRNSAEATNSADLDMQRERAEQLENALQNPWSEGQYPLVAGWLNANQIPLQKIREAAQRPKYYSPMISPGKCLQVMAIRLYLAQHWHTIARILMAHAMHDIQEEEIKDAREDILACHRLARLEGQGPSLPEALVAIRIDGMACLGDAALAQSGKLTRSDAIALLRELQEMPPMPKMYEKIDKYERSLHLDVLVSMAHYGPKAFMILISASPEFVSQVFPEQMRQEDPFSGELNQPAFNSLDWNTMLETGNSWYDRLVNIGHVPSRAERKKDLKKLDEDLKSKAPEVKAVRALLFSPSVNESSTSRASRIEYLLISLLAPAMPAMLEAEDRDRVYSDLSQLSLALAAHKTEYNHYPERLTGLVPQSIAQLPKDRFSEADYIYRREGTGYILYSVGDNGKDDGGHERYEDTPGDDFVIRAAK